MGPRVLLVCTANICRSPTAARLLAARLGPSIDFFSRGIRAVPGAEMCALSGDWVAARGGEAVDQHVARQLQLADVRSSTLILTASQRQRAAVIELRPSAQVRTFTLIQAARIARWRRSVGALVPADAAMPERLLWLAEELDAHRGSAPRPDAESDDDLPDPHVGARHPDVLERLLAAVDDLAAPLLSLRLRPATRRSPNRN